MNLKDAELAMFKWFADERNRDTAHVTAAPADTAQCRRPRLLTPKILPDACVSMEKKNKGVEEKDQGRMNPEPTELELPSACTGLETPGQQCPPNGETRRTTADGYLLVGVGSNSGGETLFSPLKSL